MGEDLRAIAGHVLVEVDPGPGPAEQPLEPRLTLLQPAASPRRRVGHARRRRKTPPRLVAEAVPKAARASRVGFGSRGGRTQRPPAGRACGPSGDSRHA
jgi:hypothetical protein